MSVEVPSGPTSFYDSVNTDIEAQPNQKTSFQSLQVCYSSACKAVMNYRSLLWKWLSSHPLERGRRKEEPPSIETWRKEITDYWEKALFPYICTLEPSKTTSLAHVGT